MDIATIVGLLGAVTLIVHAMGNPLTFWNVPSAFIVIGGTIAATLASNPLKQFMSFFSIYGKTINTSATSPNELIEKIVGFAETARREGILALEQAVEEANDEFLSGGIRLAVDGTEPDLIMDILETELLYIEERHNQASEMIARAAEMAPAFGMVGTLVGLVLMLQDMSDPAAIGPSMAVALLTTLYGSIMANVLLNPIAAKLKIYSKEEVLSKRMIIEGIMAIQQGDNPRIVEHKLSVFLPPSLRPSGEEGSGGE
ncbi:MAG: motility protein A [Candidatus Latescibacterota bacterium]|nr:motility protein A [Candidatus Latescibacterota bacterium]